MHQLGRVHTRGKRHDIAAHSHGHHHLFQRSVAGALAQPVDCTLDLTGATFDGGKAVSRRHAQIVVTMGGKNNFIGPRHLGYQSPDQIGTFTRRGVPHGVRDIDRRGTGFDGDFDHARQIFPFRPGCIHR